MVCIFHQEKEGTHWEGDTKRFKEWNEIVFSLSWDNKLTSEGKMSFMLAFRYLSDNFATTLNIFSIFKIYSEDNQGNLTNTPHFYKGYYAI